MHMRYRKAHVCANTSPGCIDRYGRRFITGPPPGNRFYPDLMVQEGRMLQELVAPTTVKFSTAEWIEIGTKQSLATLLSNTTGYPPKVLRCVSPEPTAVLAERMSLCCRTVRRPVKIWRTVSIPVRDPNYGSNNGMKEYHPGSGSQYTIGSQSLPTSGAREWYGSKGMSPLLNG